MVQSSHDYHQYDVRIEQFEISGINCEWVFIEDSDPHRVLVYFHGGGYVLGVLSSFRDLASKLSRTSGLKVLLVDYSLAPEHHLLSTPIKLVMAVSRSDQKSVLVVVDTWPP